MLFGNERGMFFLTDPHRVDTTVYEKQCGASSGYDRIRKAMRRIEWVRPYSTRNKKKRKKKTKKKTKKKKKRKTLLLP